MDDDPQTLPASPARDDSPRRPITADRVITALVGGLLLVCGGAGLWFWRFPFRDAGGGSPGLAAILVVAGLFALGVGLLR